MVQFILYSKDIENGLFVMDAPVTPTASPLRVVMIAHSHLLGGMERHVVTLSDALARSGHSIAFAGPMDGWLGEQMKAAGYPCCHVAMNGMYDAVSAIRIVRFAKRMKADIVHGHSQRGGRYAYLASRWLNIPAVATAHSTNSSKWFKRRVHVIAVSQAVKSFLLSKGLSDQQVSVVHLGIADVAQVRWPAPDAVSSQRPLRLGMVSRMEHVKGHDVALRALMALKDKLPVTLTVVGDDRNHWGDAMKKVVNDHGLGAQVRFLGQRSDVADLLGELDLLLAPSRREALSLTLIEAAASARPAVASDIGGIPEVVLNHQTGILVPSEDHERLAQAVEMLANNPELRVAYGCAARQYYEREFTIDAMGAKTQAVYQAAIAVRNGLNTA